MKILSIDFDYFEDIKNKDILTSFPDGIDLPTDLSIYTWSSYYSDDRLIENVGFLEDEYNLLQDLLYNIKDNVNLCMITQSHKDIYDFIKKYNTDDTLSITNIDMHHDMFNDNKETVDCGNWLGNIANEYETEIEWVVNPISESTYGLGEEFSSILKHSIDELDDDYDYVFLCRSDNWLPPHLDVKFNELKDYIVNDLELQCLYNRCLDRDRYSEVIKLSKQMTEVVEQMLYKHIESKDDGEEIEM